MFPLNEWMTWSLTTYTSNMFVLLVHASKCMNSLSLSLSPPPPPPPSPSYSFSISCRKEKLDWYTIPSSSDRAMSMCKTPARKVWISHSKINKHMREREHTHTPVALHSWHRYFCQFRKKDIANQKIKQVRFHPVGHQGQVRMWNWVYAYMSRLYAWYILIL